MAYKLKRSGRLVSLIISVTTRPDGQEVLRRKTVTGYEGDVFNGGDKLPRLTDSVIERIENGELGDVWEVVPDVQEEASTPDPKPTPKKSPDKPADPSPGNDTTPKPYDPGEHNQDEVLAYLATADDAEVERVKALEAAGPKNRAGIAAFTKEPSGS